MRSRAITVFLTLALFASANLELQSGEEDLELALAFIKCTQKALLTGLPEAQIPSHNPLKFSSNFTFTIPQEASNLTVHLDNLEMVGIPFWNVTQADVLYSDDDIDAFNYTIYWRYMYLDGLWSYETEGSEEAQSGTLYIELDHVNFAGIWNFTKPGDGRNETLNVFTLDVTTEEAQINITNLGLLGDVVNVSGGIALAYLINHDPVAEMAAEALKEKLIRDWMLKPERIDAIITYCNADN